MNIKNYFSDIKRLQRLFKKNKMYYEYNEKYAINELKVIDTLAPQMICVLFDKKGRLIGFGKEAEIIF